MASQRSLGWHTFSFKSTKIYTVWFIRELSFIDVVDSGRNSINRKLVRHMVGARLCYASEEEYFTLLLFLLLSSISITFQLSQLYRARIFCYYSIHLIARKFLINVGLGFILKKSNKQKYKIAFYMVWYSNQQDSKTIPSRKKKEFNK